VAFHEVFSNGSQTISRVLMNRMVGSAFQGAVEADGQSFGGTGATAPAISMMQYGNGFVTSELQGPDQVWATVLGQNGAAGPAQEIDSLPNTTEPYPTSAIAGDYTGLIAWQHDPGLLAAPEIRARFYSSAAFGPEMVVSNPASGATNAAEGLLAAGDHGGDVAIAYVQGTGASTTIQVAQLVYPPGSFGVMDPPSRYQTTTTPPLAWTAPRELWGPTSYAVTIDGVASGSTTGTSFRPTVPLAQGPHSFVVTAVNAHGLTSAASPGHFFVDSLPPVGQFTLSGAEHINATLHLRVHYTDAQTGVPVADTSGVATVVVSWGDGTSNRIRVTSATHRYLRTGRYTIKITITDRAGNRTVLSKQIRITTKKAGHAGKKKKK
jgi:hypothetical protein